MNAQINHGRRGRRLNIAVATIVALSAGCGGDSLSGEVPWAASERCESDDDGTITGPGCAGDTALKPGSTVISDTGLSTTFIGADYDFFYTDSDADIGQDQYHMQVNVEVGITNNTDEAINTTWATHVIVDVGDGINMDGELSEFRSVALPTADTIEPGATVRTTSRFLSSAPGEQFRSRLIGNRDFFYTGTDVRQLLGQLFWSDSEIAQIAMPEVDFPGLTTIQEEMVDNERLNQYFDIRSAERDPDTGLLLVDRTST